MDKDRYLKEIEGEGENDTEREKEKERKRDREKEGRKAERQVIGLIICPYFKPLICEDLRWTFLKLSASTCCICVCVNVGVCI